MNDFIFTQIIIKTFLVFGALALVGLSLSGLILWVLWNDPDNKNKRS